MEYPSTIFVSLSKNSPLRRVGIQLTGAKANKLAVFGRGAYTIDAGLRCFPPRLKPGSWKPRQVIFQLRLAFVCVLSWAVGGGSLYNEGVVKFFFGIVQRFLFVINLVCTSWRNIRYPIKKLGSLFTMQSSALVTLVFAAFAVCDPTPQVRGMKGSSVDS